MRHAPGARGGARSGGRRSQSRRTAQVGESEGGHQTAARQGFAGAFPIDGKGWQTRINDTLRKAARLKRAWRRAVNTKNGGGCSPLNW